jgi:hypothetical protein
MAEAFNLFNIANLSGYGNGLVQTAAFGPPTVRAAQIFGSGGTRRLNYFTSCNERKSCGFENATKIIPER